MSESYPPLPEWITRPRIVLAVALIALPGWILVVGPPQRVWASATANLEHFHSLYEVAPTDSNPNSTRYVYLPVFALANSALLAAPKIVTTLLPGTSEFGTPHRYFFTSLWGYIGLGSVAVATAVYGETRDVTEAQSKFLVLVVVAFPLSFVLAIYRGSDLLVAGLFIATLAALNQSRYVDAGLFASLSTFKFTGIPVAGTVVAYVLYRRDRASIRQLFTGLVIGQLPNAVYFILFPDDLWYIIENRGALSTYAYRIGDFHTYLLPVRSAGLEAAYTLIGFPVVVVAFTLIAIVVAIRMGPLLGMAVAYFPMAYLIPAERRYIPLLVLLLVTLVLLWDREWARWAVVALFVVQAYVYVLANFGTNIEMLVPLQTPFVQAVPIFHGALLLAVVVAVYRSRREAQTAT